MGATIGETLRELRQAKKKTLEEAANEIGITRSALGNYENNIRVPRDNIKIAIADYYRKPIQKMFFPRETHET
jgi:transcriptional regulator with XRE-family HTH domain